MEERPSRELRQAKAFQRQIFNLPSRTLRRRAIDTTEERKWE